jgi:hypothetical protein
VQGVAIRVRAYFVHLNTHRCLCLPPSQTGLKGSGNATLALPRRPDTHILVVSQVSTSTLPCPHIMITNTVPTPSCPTTRPAGLPSRSRRSENSPAQDAYLCRILRPPHQSSKTQLTISNPCNVPTHLHLPTRKPGNTMFVVTGLAPGMRRRVRSAGTWHQAPKSIALSAAVQTLPRRRTTASRDTCQLAAPCPSSRCSRSSSQAV